MFSILYSFTYMNLLWYIYRSDNEFSPCCTVVCMFLGFLFQFNIEHRVLLTGTPVQNDLKELYSLLCFVAPNIFKEKYGEQFIQHFSGVEDSSGKWSVFFFLNPKVSSRYQWNTSNDWLIWLIGWFFLSEWWIRTNWIPWLIDWLIYSVVGWLIFQYMVEYRELLIQYFSWVKESSAEWSVGVPGIHWLIYWLNAWLIGL